MTVTFVPNTPRYEDVTSVLKDERFSAANRAPQRRLNRPTTMVTADPPDHTRLRKSLRHRFSLTAVNALRPRIQDIIDDLIERATPATEMDIVSQLAKPLPRTIMLELLGVPDPELVQAKSHQSPRAKSSSDESVPAKPRGIPLAPGTAMPAEAFFVEAIEKHREEAEDDLLGVLLEAEAGRRLSAEEVLDTATILYGAGQETTAKMIAAGFYHLLKNPEQLEKLRRDPTLIESATEEVLRYDAPAQAITRRAMADVAIGPQMVPKGQKVLCVLAAANRDPEVFDDPEQFDIERDPNPHVAFGSGIHACLGGTLARAEIQTVIRTILARFPNIELATDDVEWEGSFIIRGLARLPVALR
jgi:cytochrome P450